MNGLAIERIIGIGTVAGKELLDRLFRIRAMERRGTAGLAVERTAAGRAPIRNFRGLLEDLGNDFNHEPKVGKLIVTVLRRYTVGKPFKRSAEARIGRVRLQHCQGSEQLIVQRFEGSVTIVSRSRVIERFAHSVS